VLKSSSPRSRKRAAAAKAQWHAECVIEDFEAVRQTAGYADANVKATAAATAEAGKAPRNKY